jgi:hypothetical protein
MIGLLKNAIARLLWLPPMNTLNQQNNGFAN